MLDVVVIGGGIAGLAAAHRLQELAVAGDRPLKIRLIESSPRLGGKVLTHRRDGFVLEGGPDSFIPQKPWAFDLARKLGLESQLLGSNDKRRGAFVVQQGQLTALPDGLSLLVPQRWAPFLRSPLLSWRGKLRVAGERWIPPRHATEDESLADFVRRRLGSEALEKLAEPLLAHIHVADIERMSIAATYPRLADLERRHGSLLRGLGKLAGPSAPTSGAPLFWSLRGGMEQLTSTLADQLPEETKLVGNAVRKLTAAAGEGFRVELSQGEALHARAVILAVPAFVAADLLRALHPATARALDRIRYVSMATLSLGFHQVSVSHDLAGFGFFVPRQEQRHILACTWTSSKFDYRAPDGQVLLRAFLGGAGQEEILALDDQEIVAAVVADLERLMGIRAKPTLALLHRWDRGYPQYDVHHLELIESLEESMNKGLVLAGSAFHGVGMPDCIHSGQRAAEAAIHHLGSPIPG